MKINIKKVVQVEAKTIQVHAKIRDGGSYTLFDQDEDDICCQDNGYVPSFFPEGGGDYLVLDINLETGVIENWKVPEPQAIIDFVERAGCGK